MTEKRIASKKTISWLLSENKKLRAFAREVMESWPDGGIEGDDLPEIAVKHGMLAPEIRHEPCGEWCQCNQASEDTTATTRPEASSAIGERRC